MADQFQSFAQLDETFRKRWKEFSDAWQQRCDSMWYGPVGIEERANATMEAAGLLSGAVGAMLRLMAEREKEDTNTQGERE